MPVKAFFLGGSFLFPRIKLKNHNCLKKPGFLLYDYTFSTPAMLMFDVVELAVMHVYLLETELGE